MNIKTEDIVSFAVDVEVPAKLKEICNEIDVMNYMIETSFNDILVVKEVSAELSDDGKEVSISSVYKYGFGAFCIVKKRNENDDDYEWFYKPFRKASRVIFGSTNPTPDGSDMVMTMVFPFE